MSVTPHISCWNGVILLDATLLLVLPPLHLDTNILASHLSIKAGVRIRRGDRSRPPDREAASRSGGSSNRRVPRIYSNIEQQNKIQIELRTYSSRTHHTALLNHILLAAGPGRCVVVVAWAKEEGYNLLPLLFSSRFIPETDIVLWWIMMTITLVSFRHSKWWRCQFSVVELRQKIHLSFLEGNDLSF